MGGDYVIETSPLSTGSNHIRGGSMYGVESSVLVLVEGRRLPDIFPPHLWTHAPS